jgi:ATP synthase protein I
MTTASPGHPPNRRSTEVLGPLASTGLVGLLAVGLGALVAGSSAAIGAGIGVAMVCLFFAAGAVVLGVVAMIAPAMSLLVALLTYTLKVVLMGLVFVGLSRSGALEESVDPRWLGGTVIVCTLVWLATQITVSMRVRQPLYDLPSEGQEASVR